MISNRRFLRKFLPRAGIVSDVNLDGCVAPAQGSHPAPDIPLEEPHMAPTCDSTDPDDAQDQPARLPPTAASNAVPHVALNAAPNAAQSANPSVSSNAVPMCVAPSAPACGIPDGSAQRKSSRQRAQRSVYDAAKGTYVAPASR